MQDADDAYEQVGRPRGVSREVWDIAVRCAIAINGAAPQAELPPEPSPFSRPVTRAAGGLWATCCPNSW
jgi:hypothetical protein